MNSMRSVLVMLLGAPLAANAALAASGTKTA